MSARRSRSRRPAGAAARPAALLLTALLALTAVAGCADPIAAGREACAARSIALARCDAILARALAGLGPGTGPMAAVDVRLADQGDRTTLRDQQLVAIVRFSFLDGSVAVVPVYCGPRGRGGAACGSGAPG